MQDLLPLAENAYTIGKSGDKVNSQISTKNGRIGTGWLITLVDMNFNLLKTIGLYIAQKPPD